MVLCARVFEVTLAVAITQRICTFYTLLELRWASLMVDTARPEQGGEFGPAFLGLVVRGAVSAAARDGMPQACVCLFSVDNSVAYPSDRWRHLNLRPPRIAYA